MTKRNPKVVVTGFIGLLPAGGVTWDYIQYPLGFRELGCDVLSMQILTASASHQLKRRSRTECPRYTCITAPL